MPGVLPGPDGLSRCPWALSGLPADQRYLDYHDEEWGRPLHGDVPLFERLCLEAFQSGLSWITVLRKRPAFRAAFAGFDPVVVAGYGEHDIARLLEDPGIIRNAAKIRAVIGNARALCDLQSTGRTLDELVWSHAPAPRARPDDTTDVPATTPESAALARQLRAAGFRFVGPTTAYALMQACGLVDDHLAGCVAGAVRDGVSASGFGCSSGHG